MKSENNKKLTKKGKKRMVGNNKKLTKIEKKTNGRKIDRTELLRTVDRKLEVPGAICGYYV